MALPIADRVLESLARRKSVFKVLNDHENRIVREKLYAACRSARRFYLDDETTMLAARLGATHPEMLLYNLRRARLPFERCLFEYSVHAFLRGGGREPAHDSPERTACVIERRSPTRFRLTTVGILENEHAFLGATSIEWDIEEELTRSPDLPFLRHGWKTFAESRGVTAFDGTGRQGLIDARKMSEAAIDYTINSCLVGSAPWVFKQISEEESDYYHQTIGKLIAHARHILEPAGAGLIRRESYKIPDIANIVGESICEYAGQWRMMLGVLQLINSQDFISDTPFRVGNKSRFIAGTVVPYLEHRRVTLKVPRKVATRKIIAILGESIPRRRHEVMGHYRHRHGVGDPGCMHVFVNVTETRERCELCGYDRWWVDEHERGDASLGYVSKDRVVESRKTDILK